MRDNRSCTCHPDEAPKPCQRHFGLSECFMAAEIERLRAALRRIDRMEVYEADAHVVLWGKIGIMRDIARAALEERT